MARLVPILLLLAASCTPVPKTPEASARPGAPGAAPSWRSEAKAKWLERSLALKPDQAARLREILKADAEAQARLDRERREKIRALLDEEQRRKLDGMLQRPDPKERQERFAGAVVKGLDHRLKLGEEQEKKIRTKVLEAVGKAAERWQGLKGKDSPKDAARAELAKIVLQAGALAMEIRRELDEEQRKVFDRDSAKFLKALGRIAEKVRERKKK